MEKIKKIIFAALDYIADIYLYILLVYLFCFGLSFFFERWKFFFNWKVFHLSVISLGALSLFYKQSQRTKNVREKILRPVKNLQKKRKMGVRMDFRQLFSLLRTISIVFAMAFLTFGKAVAKIAKALLEILKLTISRLNSFFLNFSWGQRLKVLMFITLIFGAVFLKAGMASIVVFAYFLFAALFLRDVRPSLILAVLFMILALTFFIFKKEKLSFILAAYFYFFLLMTFMGLAKGAFKKEKSFPQLPAF